MSKVYDRYFDMIVKERNIDWKRVGEAGITTNWLAHKLAALIIEKYWAEHCENLTIVEHFKGQPSRLVQPQEVIPPLIRGAAIQGIKTRVIYRLRKLGFKGDYNGVHREMQNFQFEAYRQRRLRREGQNAGNLINTAKEIIDFGEDLAAEFEAWKEDMDAFVREERA